MTVSKENSGKYFWGENCESWILNHSENLIIKQEKMPSNTKEQIHYHEKAEQFFYILSGTAIFYLENEKFLIQENQGISVKPETKHFIANENPKDLEFLVISSSATENDRILVNFNL